jgi:hypothetical protein
MPTNICHFEGGMGYCNPNGRSIGYIKVFQPKKYIYTQIKLKYLGDIATKVIDWRR